MAVPDILKHDIEEKVQSLINKLGGKVGDKHSMSSYEVATQTVEILTEIVAKTRWQTSIDLSELIRHLGLRLASAQPSEVVVDNMVRRVLKVIHDEVERTSQVNGSTTAEPGSSRLGRSGMDLGRVQAKAEASTEGMLREDIVEALGELQSELETSLENITRQSLEHIHADEVILTAGHSSTVEKFLKYAGSRRNTTSRDGEKRGIKVIVAEGAPHFQGHKMAATLSKENIDVTLITDSAVFAIMSRVNKVILGTHSILADGGLQSIAGSHMIAISAAHHSVPLIVVSSMYKLSPQFFRSSDQETFNQFLSPEKIFPEETGGVLIGPSLHIPCPLFDYVPPELVTLIVSNVGGHAPSYVYRLLSDLYLPDEYEPLEN